MMHQIFKNFFISFLLLFILGLIVLFLFTEIKLALIISLFYSFILSLSVLGFTQRTLKSVTLEVNMNNKSSDKGMKWYEDRIRKQILDNGFQFFDKEDMAEVFKPRTLYKVYEPTIYLEVETYCITVKASRLMVRMIADYIEIPMKENES